MWLLPFLLLPLFLLISCKKNKGMKKKQLMKGDQSAKSSVLSGGGSGGGRELSTNKSRELILTGGGGSKETLTCGSRETLSKEGSREGVSEPAGELLYSTEPAGEKKEAPKLDKLEKKQGNKEKTVAGTKAGQEKKKKPPKREEEKELPEMEATQRSEIAEEDGEAKGMEPSKIPEAKKSPVLPVKEPPSPISKDGIYVPTLFLQWKPEIVEEGQYEQMTPPGNKEKGQYENLGGEKSAVHGVEKSSDGGGGGGGQYEALGPALSSRPSQESLYEQMGSVNTAGKEGLYEALGDSPSKMCRPSPTKT